MGLGFSQVSEEFSAASFLLSGLLILFKCLPADICRLYDESLSDIVFLVPSSPCFVL